jgi:hypothetical protein
MNEPLISAVIKRVGISPLERLAWAVDFSERVLLTPGDQSNAELELTCFMWAQNLQPDEKHSIQAQIKAITNDFADASFKGKEVLQAQEQFTKILKAAAGQGWIEIERFKYLGVKFTRSGGVNYVNRIRHGGMKAKMEALTYKLLRLLDKTVRTSLAKAKGGERVTPVRMYVGICPKDRDGCGKLFAKTRIDQEYCSRTCVSRAQVHRFRRNERAKRGKEA